MDQPMQETDGNGAQPSVWAIWWFATINSHTDHFVFNLPAVSFNNKIMSVKKSKLLFILENGVLQRQSQFC